MANTNTPGGKPSDTRSEGKAASDSREQILGGPPQADVVPAALDDAAEAQDAMLPAPAAEEAPAEQQPEAPRARPQPSVFASSRENIAKLYREKRDLEEKADRAEKARQEGREPEPETMGEADQHQAAEPSEQVRGQALGPRSDGQAASPVSPAEAPAAPPAAQGQQRSDKITLIIDGKSVEKPLDEVIRHAQKDLAADNRLEEAKRLLQEARALRASAGPAEHQPSGQPQAAQPSGQARGQAPAQPEHQPEEASDPEVLKQIAERIQVGDADEGAQALQEHEERIVARLTKRLGGANAPPDVRELVRQEYVQNQTRNEITSALSRFADKYQDLVKDEVLAEAGKTVLRNEIIADLKSAGVTDDAIAPFRNNVEALAQAQRTLRLNGHDGLRDYDKLLNAVGETMTAKFGIKPSDRSSEGRPKAPTTESAGNAPAQPRSQPQPRPAQIIDPAQKQAREDRKRAAPQQPRTAGGRVAAPPPPGPRTPAQIIQEQRKARGFPTSG